MDHPVTEYYAQNLLFENGLKVSPQITQNRQFFGVIFSVNLNCRWPAVPSNVVHGETD